MSANPPGREERWISFGPGTISVPERLLLDHARGRVIFITGAGTSLSAGLPTFRDLAREVYAALESTMLAELKGIVANGEKWRSGTKFVPDQHAELGRFGRGDYDVVLGMLERRLDPGSGPSSSVRREVVQILRAAGTKPTEIHRSLVRLADRGEGTTIFTTNYDLLLEKAATGLQRNVRSLCLGAIPRPGRGSEFAGIMHIHGALPRGNDDNPCEIVLTDRDFGEYYLRRRIIPDLVYDAARLFSLVLVGYSANDAPMRYLLNAVAADNLRFDDLQPRYVFVGGGADPDPIEMADWRARGLTPIPYDDQNRHAALGTGLQKWAQLSAINGDGRALERLVSGVVRRPRETVSEYERDLVEHFFRRGNDVERTKLAKLANEVHAHPAWLNEFALIARERGRP